MSNYIELAFEHHTEGQSTPVLLGDFWLRKASIHEVKKCQTPFNIKGFRGIDSMRDPTADRSYSIICWVPECIWTWSLIQAHRSHQGVATMQPSIMVAMFQYKIIFPLLNEVYISCEHQWTPGKTFWHIQGAVPGLGSMIRDKWPNMTKRLTPERLGDSRFDHDWIAQPVFMYPMTFSLYHGEFSYFDF